MRVQHAAIGDRQAFRHQRLKPGVVRPARHRGLDPRIEQLLEQLEELVLQRDRQRQHAVQERRDRRQFLDHRAFLRRQAKAGRGLEGLKAHERDRSGEDAAIELRKRGARIDAFEIVLGPKEALAAGLALAAGDRAQRVEAPRNGRDEAPLALHIGHDGPEQRRLRLVRPVGAAEPLDGGVGLPAGLQQIMNALSLVPRRKVGVIAATRSAGVGEDENALLVIHERIGHLSTCLVEANLLISKEPFYRMPRGRILSAPQMHGSFPGRHPSLSLS